MKNLELKYEFEKATKNMYCFICKDEIAKTKQMYPNKIYLDKSLLEPQPNNLNVTIKAE